MIIAPMSAMSEPSRSYLVKACFSTKFSHKSEQMI